MTDGRKKSSRAELVKKLQELQRQEEEMISMVESIDVSLIDMGYPLQPTVGLRNKSSGKTAALNGIRINNELSFRGLDKASEYFSVVDNDKDGLLCYQDFIAMKAFSSKEGIVHDSEYSSWHAWRHMLQALGIFPTSKGEIWATLKSLIQEIKDFKKFQEESGIVPETSSNTDDFVLLDEIPYILSNAGYPFSKPEIAKHVLQICRKSKTMEDLNFKYAKRNISDGTYEFSIDEERERLLLQWEDPSQADVSVRNLMSSVKRSQFLAWFFSTPITCDFKDYYRKLVEWKYNIFRYLRKMDAFFRLVYTLVFRDFKNIGRLTSVQTDISTMKFGFWKMTKMESPATVLKKMEIPTDSGLSIVIDFAFNKDALSGSEEEKMEERKKTAQYLRQFLTTHFEKELRNNSQFAGFTIFPIQSEVEPGLFLLRVAMAYRRIASLDWFLSQMLIPYKFCDIVSVCNGDIRTNFDPEKLVNEKYKSLSDTFALTAEITLGMRRNMVIMILERIELAMRSALTEEQSVALEGDDAPDQKDPRNRTKEASIGRYCGYVRKALKVTKSCVLKFKYSSLGELFHTTGLVSPWFSRTFPEIISSKVAYARDTYKSISAKFSNEIEKLYSYLDSFLEVKKKNELNRRIEEIMSGTGAGTSIGGDSTSKAPLSEKEKLQRDTEEKMRRIGMASDASLFEEEENSPSIEVLCGEARVTANFAGIDFMSLLPKIPSMQASIEAHKIRPKGAAVPAKS
eukprot:gene26604-35276_t